MLTLLAAARILLALLGTPAVYTESGNAAVYGHVGDKLAGGPLACTGKPLNQRALVCAHRTLPCGTPLLIQSVRTRRLAACQVLDRGPYGAQLPGGRFVVKLRPSQRGTWRSVVDLSPAVAQVLGVKANGREPVRIIYPRLGKRLGLDAGQRAAPLVAPPPPATPSAAAPWPFGPLGWL